MRIDRVPRTRSEGGKYDAYESETEIAPLLAPSLRALAAPFCAVRAAARVGSEAESRGEKQALSDYVAALKEELQDAEEYLKELEAGK